MEVSMAASFGRFVFVTLFIIAGFFVEILFIGFSGILGFFFTVRDPGAVIAHPLPNRSSAGPVRSEALDKCSTG